MGHKKKEGDLITPLGTYKISQLFYRKDRVKKLFSKIKKIEIKKNMGWCNDSKSSKYNRLIRYPFKFNSEKLYRKDNIYDIILVLNYNTNPIKKRKCNFYSCCKKKFEKTEGCLAISKKQLKEIVKFINKKQKL